MVSSPTERIEGPACFSASKRSVSLRKMITLYHDKSCFQSEAPSPDTPCSSVTSIKPETASRGEKLLVSILFRTVGCYRRLFSKKLSLGLTWKITFSEQEGGLGSVLHLENQTQAAQQRGRQDIYILQSWYVIRDAEASPHIVHMCTLCHGSPSDSLVQKISQGATIYFSSSSSSPPSGRFPGPNDRASLKKCFSKVTATLNEI